MDTIGYHDGLAFEIHLQQFAGVEDAGVAVLLALIIQEEGVGDGVGQGGGFNGQFQLRSAEQVLFVERIVSIQQAVGDAVDAVQLGRKPS